MRKKQNQDRKPTAPPFFRPPQNLSFHVPVGGHWTTILRNVTGACRAARLTACMGPSGAGKSTLLKILACAIPGGAREGDLMANGE